MYLLLLLSKTIANVIVFICKIRLHITSHHITSHHITSHHITSHYITSHHITSNQIKSNQITSHHITSHHITSHYITLHYNTISPTWMFFVSSFQCLYIRDRYVLQNKQYKMSCIQQRETIVTSGLTPEMIAGRSYHTEPRDIEIKFK